MDKNEREAAERLVQFHDEYDYTYWDGNKSPWCPNADGVTVARAYLAEHPIDDEGPFDKAYLVSLGGHDDWHPQKVTFKRPDCLDIGLWLVDDGWKAMLIHSGNAATCVMRGIKTRRQLRDFARALGIQLSDSDTRKG